VYILKCNNNKISLSAFIFLCKEREREREKQRAFETSYDRVTSARNIPQPIYTECAEDYITTLHLTPPFVLWSSVRLILELFRLYQVLFCISHLLSDDEC
jgi:hypothetical protein